jgi:hypothetical protein
LLVRATNELESASVPDDASMQAPPPPTNLPPPHAEDERLVTYWLLGSFDPYDVSEATRIRANRIAHIGDRLPNGRTVERAWWAVESGLARDREVHEHFGALLERLRPAWPVLRRFGQEQEAGFEVTLYCREAQGPLVQLDPAVSRAAAELNATIGFDIYVLSERVIPDDYDLRPLTRLDLGRPRRPGTG